MSMRPSGMTDLEIDVLLSEVARGAITARTAMALMTLKGEDPAEVARMVFRAIGGGDVTCMGADGRLRYANSGRIVSEVEAIIAEATDEVFGSKTHR